MGSGSITPSRAGEQGETYFVRWPVGTEKLAFLAHHLREGVDKDERLTLAIYFFWEEDTEQVIVGWLPSHLENRMTRLPLSSQSDIATQPFRVGCQGHSDNRMTKLMIWIYLEL